MSQSPPTIAPQILVLSLVLSIIWGIVLISAIRDYRRTVVKRRGGDRRGGDLVSALRWFFAVLCVFSINSAYLLRTSLVLAGFGSDTAGQVVFFALLSTDIVGGLFALISLRYD